MVRSTIAITHIVRQPNGIVFTPAVRVSTDCGGIDQIGLHRQLFVKHEASTTL